MEYILLGKTGLRVSRIALGTALLGLVPVGDEADRLIHGAFDLGVNFFDCANTYGNRASFDRPGVPTHDQRESAEVVLGRALKSHRDDVVLCTKLSEPVGSGPNDAAERNGGLSRYHMMREVERSLKRLDTDHIDIYHAHHPDNATAIEETLQAFDDLIRQGKVLYCALSTYSGWQMTQAVLTAEKYGYSRPVLNQQQYNMMNRGVEREVVPAALALGLQLTCFSPLAGGALAGLQTMQREYSGSRRWGFPAEWTEDQKRVATELSDLAKDWGYAPPQLALRWLLSRPAIASAIIGPENLEELKENLGLFDVVLDDAQFQQLDAIGRPGPAAN